jgi:mRNA-degrading endonuclease RelE of RelBE toxin-antitoxin system
VKSRTTGQFRKSLANLPKQVQEQARAAYRQFKENPSHPSLRFKKVHPELPIYSARISKNYRAVGQLDEDTVICFWVGSHTEL